MMTPGHVAPRPSFGLIIPTYNRPGYVRDAVVSALEQSQPFDRIIVVCDGPQPATAAALADLGVTVIEKPRGGVSAARNAGVRALDTDWVCFLDDDDLLHPSYLARVEAAVARPDEPSALDTHYWVMGEAGAEEDADFVAHDYRTAMATLPPGEPSRSFDYMDIHGRSFDLLLERMRGSLSGTAVRREVLLKAGGFPESLRCAEDWTMYVNVSRFVEWTTLPSALVVFRHHQSERSTVHGGASNGLDTLRAAASFWAATDLPTPPHRPLHDYRPSYRFILRWTLARCRQERNPRAFAEALRIARPILPRAWDRWRALVPSDLRDRLRLPASRDSVEPG